MQVTPDTMALAQEISDYFLEHPERHNQISWVGERLASPEDITDENVCNTTMCIAGSAVYLTEGVAGLRRHLFHEWDFEDSGAELLGLEHDEAYWLFYSATNEQAIDAVRAIANGDEDKFRSLYEG